MPPQATPAGDALTPASVVARSPEPASARLDDEIVTMSVRRGSYYALGTTGTRVWELIEHPVAVASVVDRLRAEYDVDEATCRADVLAFLEELRREELLEVTGAHR
jgi:hypothetical protein